MTMAMVDVDGSCQFSADSQPKSTGLICGLAATLRSVCIHQMNRVNSRSDFGHDDSIINIVIAIINIIVIGLSVSMWVRAFSDRHFHISLPSTSSPVSAHAVLIRVHFCCLRFCFFSTKPRNSGWEECLQSGLFCVEWDAVFQLTWVIPEKGR